MGPFQRGRSDCHGARNSRRAVKRTRAKINLSSCKVNPKIPICQLNPPAPAESLTVSISGAQREACRANIVEAAAAIGLPCD